MRSTIEGLVSTIIPVHNRPRLLAEAVSSVLSQTYRQFELIIVDDGSTDDTASVAREFMDREPTRVRVLAQANGGPGRARERGRVEAQGEFIQYLDSDDILMPDKFERQIGALRRDGGCGVAYGKTRYLIFGASPADVPWKRTGEVIETLFPSMLDSRWWGTSTPLYRRAVTDAAGPWTDLWVEEDWEYDCRIAKQGVRLAFCDVFVSEEREHDGPRLSGSRTAHTLTQRARAHELILEHARAGGVPFTSPEMRKFARELFHLSRECGAAGLDKDAKKLFNQARVASGSLRSFGIDFTIYRIAAGVLGWVNAGKLARYIDERRVPGGSASRVLSTTN